MQNRKKSIYLITYVSIVAAIMFLSACAIKPESTHPTFTSDVVVVPYDKLDSYWVYGRFSFSSHISYTPGCAIVQVIIDSKGQIFSPKKIKVIGGDQVYTEALEAMSNVHLKPAKENPSRVPVQTDMHWNFFRSKNTSAYAPGCKELMGSAMR